jgi:hypothetical protein
MLAQAPALAHARRLATILNFQASVCSLMLMTHKPIPPSLEPFVAYIVMARGRNVDGVVFISDYDVPWE